MDTAFGQRLEEMITEKEKPNTLAKCIPVEEIVCNAKLAHMESLSNAKMENEKSMLASAMTKVQTMSDVRMAIVPLLTENREDVYKQMRETFARPYRFGLLNQGFGGKSKTATASLIQDVVERCLLSEMYRKKVAQLRLKLSLKDDLIREL